MRKQERPRASRWTGLAAGLVLLLALVAPAAGQGLSSAVIAGTVRNARNAPVNGTAVTITNVATGRKLILRTGQDGRYSTPFLPPGTYDVLAEQFGYTPERLTNVVVGPGQRVSVPVTLIATTGPVESQNVHPSNVSSVDAAGSASSRWIASREAAPLPYDTRDMSALAALSSNAGPRLDFEGLPARFTTVVVDGLPMMRRARPLGDLTRIASLPLSIFEHVDLKPVQPDIEWPSAATGYLTGQTRSGAGQIGLSAFGDWSNDALSTGGSADPAAFQFYRVGAQVGGPILQDTAHFVIGGEFTRSEIPFESLWVQDTETARLAAASRDALGVDLSPWTAPGLGRVDRFSAFGRVDFQISDGNALSVRGNFAQLPRIEPVAPWIGTLPAAGAMPESREILGSAVLTSRLDDHTVNEFNVGAELSRMKRDPTGAAELPGTIVVGAGRNFGAADATASTDNSRNFYFRETVHLDRSSHALKLGLSLTLPHYDFSYDANEHGQFVFASVDDFAARTGAFRQTIGNTTDATFSTRRFTFFAQDAWSASPGLSLQVGARFTAERLPDTTKIRMDPRWTTLTALSNAAMPGRALAFEPTFSFTWDPGDTHEWLVRGAAVVVTDAVPPDALGEVFSNNGQLLSRGTFGALGRWPAVPDSITAPTIAPTISILGPDFSGPRTSRVGFGVTRVLEGLGSLTAGFALRQTEFLPQRRDVNVLNEPLFLDQHGRPVYGNLVKSGSLLIARDSTNRRLPEFDRVWGIQATGESVYRAFTLAFERPLADDVGVFASYTYSKTESNWLGGNGADPDLEVTPFPDSLNAVDWADGRSDYDVPHRAVAGIEIKVPGRFGPRIGGIYRFQSGYPFTPGFRDGVDINADGSDRNDPAFVDPQVAGTSELVSQWPCLSDQIGGFVQRNACRAPNVQALDARLSIDVARTDRYFAQIVLDGLNLIASDYGEVDRALYLVDPTRALVVNTGSGTVNVPLIANPNFGQMITRYAPQRLIRLGIRLSY